MKKCILGLTGSIGTGKSTVSTIFKQQRIPVVDADVGARAVVEPGTTGLKRIEKTFGSSVIAKDGMLDRKALGGIVFSDADKRQHLDRLLADLIYQWIQKEKDQYIAAGADLVVLDIPLLFEAGYDKEVDKVMVVTVTEETQLERLMKRDQIKAEVAQAKIAAQLSIAEKVMRADYVIDNNGTKENTEKQVLHWLTKEGFAK